MSSIPKTIKLKRGTRDRWDLINPTLAYGEMGVILETDGTLRLKVGDGINDFKNLDYKDTTIDEINSIIDSNTSVKQTLGFGNITDSCQFVYPCTIDNTINTPKKDRTYRNMYDNFDSFKEFYWDVINYNGTSYYGQHISSMQDLVDMINSGTTHQLSVRKSGYNLNCYAKIDPAVAKINKVYGINKFYSVLKGKKNYKRHIGQWGSEYEALSWINKRDFLEKIWEHFTFPGFVTTQNYLYCAKSIWFTNNTSTMYAMLKSGHKITFPTSDSKDRYVFNYGDSDFYKHEYETMIVNSSVIVGMSGKNYTIYTENIKDKDYYSDESFIRIYKLTNTISGDTITALLVKPIGMDVFRLNYVKNDSNLNLYMLMYNGNADNKIDIRKIDNVLISGSEENRLISDFSFMVDKSVWNSAIYLSNNSRHIGVSRQRSFRFFLSDGNGNISNLSAEIKPFLFMTGAKTRTMIKDI